jgi:hypothetical protein
MYLWTLAARRLEVASSLLELLDPGTNSLL